MGFLFGVFINFTEGDGLFFKRYCKFVFPVWLIFLIGSILVPTQKEAAAIWLIPKVVNNEKIQNISEDSLGIVEAKVKEYLAELAKVKDDKSR